MQKIKQAVTALQHNAWYALTLLCLAIIGFSLLAYELSPYASPEIEEITIPIDLAIAWIFLADFFLGLFFNQKYTRREYWRHNWLDFIASIPLTADLIQVLRIFRAVRAIRIITASIHIYLSRHHYHSVKEHTK